MTTPFSEAPRRRSIAPLLGAWLAYWVGLPLVALREPIRLIYDLRNSEPGVSTATIRADPVIVAELTSGTETLWQGSTTATELVLWVAGPPLLLLALWLWWANRRERAALHEAPTQPALGAAKVDPRVPRDRVGIRERQRKDR